MSVDEAVSHTCQTDRQTDTVVKGYLLEVCDFTTESASEPRANSEESRMK